MADKMMRMAGRGADGLAKAISTDNAGIQLMKNETPVYGVNLFNKSTALANSSIDQTNGSVKSSTGWMASDYIPVNGKRTRVLYQLGYHASLSSGVAFYNADKDFISGLTGQQVIVTYDRAIPVPESAAYFRFSLKQEDVETAQISVDYTGVYHAYQEHSIDSKTAEWLGNPEVHVKQPMYTGRNLFNREDARVGLIRAETGNFATSSGWMRTHYVPIPAVHPGVISFDTLERSATAGIGFFDANKSFLSGKTNDDIVKDGLRVVIPDNARYFVASHKADIRTARWQIVLGRTVRRFVTPTSVDDLTGDWLMSLMEQAPKVDVGVRKHYPLPRVASREAFDLYQAEPDLYAIHKDVEARYASGAIYISQDGLTGSAVFNDVTFPGLIPGSKFYRMLIIPYTRNLTTYQTGQDWRLCVFTDKGQIYHNFPSRGTDTDGEAEQNDIARFQESVVWDLPERRHPSKNPAATGPEIYFPCLSDERYAYRPMLNTDPGFTDVYGNGGFGKSITHDDVVYPRFFRVRESHLHFAVMGGFEPTDKITLLGTYAPNTGSDGMRICLFATHDGGRSWYTKYEFGGGTGSIASYGEEIDTSGVSGTYASEAFVLHKRVLNIPSAEVKEPATLFTISPGVAISAITKAKPAEITTSTAHGLSTGDVICIKDNPSSSATAPGFDWMRNDDFSPTSGGNGILFRVVKISNTKVTLREYVHSAHNNIPARHIHHINRVKDGWVLGSGEVYPQGWQLYIHMRGTDRHEVVRAHHDFPITRLNSSAAGLQRTLGVILADDADATVYAAIDEARVPRGTLPTPPGRTFEVTRSSTGIFKGKLADIDDFSKFECILECKEPAYLFKAFNGTWIYCGQSGEFAVSSDQGKTWCTGRSPSVLSRYRGSSGDTHFFDDTLIVL